jgi:ornithine cyclodeaminase/alanine dehydrogenase-like protein (mu-crystallin family)
LSWPRRELIDLGAVINGTAGGRSSPRDITLHCSVGLAGTELILAALLLDQNSRE